jgi:hypothetical protein
MGDVPTGPVDDDHQLPFIDSTNVEVAASPERCWTALVSAVGGPMAGSSAHVLAIVLGCDDRVAAGSRETEGSTLSGFHVARSEPPRYWRLRGAHRFAEYSLAFRIRDLGHGLSRVEAESRARFPGWQGSLYRMLVVGSRGHRLAVHRMLRAVKARAETATTTSPRAAGSELSPAAATPPLPGRSSS